MHKRENLLQAHDLLHFLYHGHHGDLHPFPTRRSSDLGLGSCGLGLGVRIDVVSPSFILPSLSRSEEHTSELQSPCNIVCRLLLEKKKIRLRTECGRYEGGLPMLRKNSESCGM